LGAVVGFGRLTGYRVGPHQHKIHYQVQAISYLSLLLLLGLLFLLSFCDSDKSGLGTSQGRLVPAGSNDSKVSTNNTALVLHSAP
jgi:hypothetical protein